MPDPRLAAAQAEDVEDLLNHIGWQEVILPRLLKLKAALSSQLATTLLRPAGDPAAPTSLQLAARISGIDDIIRTLESILREGTRAKGLLENTPWQLNS